MSQIFKCTKCNNYTMKEGACPLCGARVVSPKPPKFSLIDRYGDYRRKAKRKTRSQSRNDSAKK